MLLWQVIEGDASEASSVREALRGHSVAINAAGHAKDGHRFHLLFKGTDIEDLLNTRLVDLSTFLLCQQKGLYASLQVLLGQQQSAWNPQESYGC